MTRKPWDYDPHEDHCAYCGEWLERVPKAKLAWTDDDTFHWECYLDRYADMVGELLVDIAEACNLFQPIPLLLAAE